MPTPSPLGDHAGERIAYFRKLARLTQRELANRIPHSYSLLTQVEAGHKSASPDLLAAVARALTLDVTSLTGQPYIAELRADRLEALVRPMREALDVYDLGADPGLRPRSLPELVAAADDVCRQVRGARLSAAAERLPALINELTTVAHTTGAAEAWGALGSAYRSTHDVTMKWGYYDLGLVALDRMGWAAERASDPLLGGVRMYMRALVYFREGNCDTGRRLITTGERFAEQAPTTVAAMAVRGQLHLGGSVLAARAEDENAAAAHLSEAREIADRIGDVSEIYWLSFGPTNVTTHELAAHLEFRRWGDALRTAKSAKQEMPAAWATSRRAHVYIDSARAEVAAGRHDAALRSINTARELAPQQTRYHPGARETIKDLVHSARRERGNLNSLAAWIGA